MKDRDPSGSILGIPYNFEQPKIRRMLGAYWQPGEGMLVPKPFGVGYTLNLANWKSWIVVGVALGLVALERKQEAADEAEEEQEPVEVLVED